MAAFCFIPLWAGDNVAATPDVLSVEHFLPEIVRSYTEKKADDNDEDEGFGRYRRHGREDNVQLTEFLQKQGFRSIMSFSHNVSSDRGFGGGRSIMGEFSITRFVDKFTPALYVAVMRPEIFPIAIIRIFSPPKDQKVKVLDFELRQAQVTNVSMSGGSGGEPVDTLSLAFQSLITRQIEIDLQTGDILDTNRSFWDSTSNSGSRDGPQTVPSLATYCKRFTLRNTQLFDRKDLSMLVKLRLVGKDEIPIEYYSTELPARGRRLFVSPESDQKHFKEILVKIVDRATIFTAICSKLNVQEEQIRALYHLDTDGKFLLEIETDSQLEDLVENSRLIVALK